MSIATWNHARSRDGSKVWDGFLYASRIDRFFRSNEGELEMRSIARTKEDVVQRAILELKRWNDPSYVALGTKRFVEGKEQEKEEDRDVTKDANARDVGLDGQLDDELLASLDLDGLVRTHVERKAWTNQFETVSKKDSFEIEEDEDVCEHGMPYERCVHSGYHHRILTEKLLVSAEILAFETHETKKRETLIRQHEKLRELRSKILSCSASIEWNVSDAWKDRRDGKEKPSTTKDVHHLGVGTKEHVSFGAIPTAVGRTHHEQLPFRFEAIETLPTMERMRTLPEDVGPVSCRRTEGSTDATWKRKDFPWSQEVDRYNKLYFGNDGFRINQLEVINATMSGRDCFVLMPTGGGKSLCFQLPALCGGVTVVISPLVSLIEDQISQLRIIDIPCAYLSAGIDYAEQRKVMDDLRSPRPIVKLLYVTPERVVQSNAFQSALQRLNENGHLARIVIDEAHCVSQWGHDFRPDYKGLWIFKSSFKNVPIMALTATATPRVQEDVVLQLRLQQCVTFRSSFNRPNLRYEVRPKKAKAVVQQIKEMIQDHYIDKFGNVMSGIIYCLSRGECEKLANQLSKTMLEYRGRDGQTRKKRLVVGYYHAGLSPAERKEVQRRWSNDDIPIICATIAFGMGINKPDVRFVMHYSMPKSLEGYHQEAGRAGRDGQVSACILLYSYADAQKAKHMIKQSALEQQTEPEHLKLNLENLDRMIAYCEEKVECRRVLQLSHFGETNFTSSQCNKTCDNCRQEKSSLSYVVDVFRGSRAAQVRVLRHDELPQYGAGSGMKKSEVERILRRMILEDILVEESHRADNQYQNVITYLRVNQRTAMEYLDGKRRFMLKCLESERASVVGKKRTRDVIDVIDVTDEYCTTVPGDELGVEIYEELLRAREEIVKMPGNEKAEKILTKAVLERISQLKPTTEEDLKKIPSLVQSHIQKFGKVILSAVSRVIQSRKHGSGWIAAGGKRDLSSFAFQSTGSAG